MSEITSKKKLVSHYWGVGKKELLCNYCGVGKKEVLSHYWGVGKKISALSSSTRGFP